ncbi:MAG: DUF309 domain-containing protein [Candidatus Binatia bacterium]
MHVSTRNLLGDLLIEALADRIAATALRCCVAYGQHAPHVASVDRFLLPASATEREQVLSVLKQQALLCWDPGSEYVALAPALIPECTEIVAKLMQYNSVLDQWQPDEEASDLTTALRKGRFLFNHHLFFEVHEVLEAQWIKETGEVKRFLQGLIQIAVAFHHLSNRNLRGALSLLHDGLEKISPFRPTFLAVELGDFIDDLEACQEELLRLGPDGLAQFQTAMIPRMQLTA